MNFGYEFFPQAIGHTWTYEADSIVYDPVLGGIAVDTIQFFIQETILKNLSRDIQMRNLNWPILKNLPF